MSSTKGTIDSPNMVLAVDDDIISLELILTQLDGQNYGVFTAKDGLEAWNILQRDHQRIGAIILDRFMPHMSGLELLGKLRANPKLAKIPVIMVTCANESDEILEGVGAGVYAYLTKPYTKHELLSSVSSALTEHKQYIELLNEINKQNRMGGYINQCQMEYRTLDDAYDLTSYLARLYPDPDQVTLGVTEMLVNAVEHGNLGITYEEKTELQKSGKWRDEVEKRQSVPENKDRKVRVSVERKNDRLDLTIEDEGQGFDWKPYLDINPERLSETHGRGIALARMFSFDNLEFHGKGNAVTCTKFINPDQTAATGTA